MSNKILVVDDDPATRKLLSILLKTTGEFLEASTGAEALRIIEAERPRIMLLDLIMPEMSGLEVLQALKASGVVMTIIVLTGQTDIAVARQALELGAAEYITKPVDCAYLEDRVRRCVKALPPEGNEDGEPPWRIAEK